MWLALQSGLLAGAVVASYASSPLANHAYMTHPLWLGAPAALIRALVGLQLLAAVAYVAWICVVELDGSRQAVPARVYLFNGLFLVSQAVWPHAARLLLSHASTATAVLASLPLWASAVGVGGLLGGSLDDPVQTGLLAVLAVLVILVDGVGWTARAIAQPSAARAN